MRRKLLILLLSVLLVAATVVAPIGALAASNSQIYIVNVDGARLRNGPSNGRIITSLKKGSRVVYGGTHKGSMYLVRASDGTKGYIYMRYLSEYGATATRNVYTVRKKTNLYKRASTSSRRVARLSKGTTVIRYETHGSWAYVRTLNGKAGYVKKSYLKKS